MYFIYGMNLFFFLSDSPKEDEMKANITGKPHNVIFADIMFEKVYPQPECIIMANVCIQLYIL